MTAEDFAPLLHTYLVLFGAALLFYDYALTFSMEVERFWLPHKVSVTTVLYFVNRYVGLLGYTPVLYQFLGMVDEDWCGRLQLYSAYYAFAVLGATAALMVVRVYAFYDRGFVVLCALGSHFALTVVMCVILQSVGILRIETIPDNPPPAPHCVPYRSLKQGKAHAIAWSLKPLFDLMVLLLTISRSSKFKQTPRPVLIGILVADGILYFAASLALGILSICFSLWAPPFLRAVGTPLTSVICSVLASRMTLNLRNPDIIPPHMETPSNPTPESEQLVSTIVNLGHPSYAESLMRSRSEVEGSVIALRRMGTNEVV